MMHILYLILFWLFCVAQAQDHQDQDTPSGKDPCEIIDEPYTNSPPCQEALDALEEYKKQQRRQARREKCDIL